LADANIDAQYRAFNDKVGGFKLLPQVYIGGVSYRF